MPKDSPPKSPWKGKARALTSIENQFDDLNPTITYRHLLATNLGVKDPLRVVALCDSDAFYAACEQVRLGIDSRLPLVVLQWESIIAVNYPARTFGISRMAKLKDAKRMCPELVVVHVATYKEGELEPGYWENVDSRTHKVRYARLYVSLDYYRRESAKIINIFKEGLPTGEIEKASIDEAFIDFTDPVREIILERYPYLAKVPADAPDGIDSPLPPPPPISWDGLGAVVPIFPEPNSPADDSEPSTRVSDDEREVHREDDEFTTWHDVALSVAAELMEKIRGEVRTQLGYTTSAGIARNKFLAKLTASYRKPNTQSILRNAAIPNYLRPMAFQKIRFLGGKLGSAIAEKYDVSTVGDLLTITLEEMQDKFGENAYWVYELLRGIDRSEVKEKSAQNKSMLASKNLPQPITKAADGHHWIRVLAAELALRLNDARKTSPTLWPKSIVLHARKGYATARSKQAAFPFTRNVTVDVIASAGDRLWRDLVGTSTAMKITSVQLAFTGLEAAESNQRSIEGFFKTPDHGQHQGSSTNGGRSLKRSREVEEDILPQMEPLEIDTMTSTDASPSPTSFDCPRCHKRISLADQFTSNEFEHDARAQALIALQVEHNDFHFAQDLSKASDQPINVAKVVAKKKKQKKEPEGIARFFMKK